MKARVQELIQCGDKLFSERFPLLTLWQTFAENFYPIRADFTRSRYISEEFASYLMTGRPVLAHRELTNALSSILRPRGMQWFKPATDNEDVNNDPNSAKWLDNVGLTMRRVFADRRSQFYRATKEGDADYVLTGQCVIEPRLNAQRNGMLYRTWHLRDAVWAENSDGEIDTVHRKWMISPRQLCQIARGAGWPLHQDIERAARDNPYGTATNGQPSSASSRVKCRAIVIPADEYDSYGKDDSGNARKYNSKLPFVSVVIDEDHQTILEETPQRKLGYVIPRWVTIGGWSQYAYSPTAVVALPEGRMLQQMTLMLLEIGAKILDPPMKAVGDAIAGGINLYAGAITWVDPDYDERTGAVLEPMQFKPEGLQWGLDREEKIHQLINEAFYLNVLNLPQYEGKEMTAYEVSERMKEYIRRATPLFEPMDTEYNGKLCDDTFDTLFYNGAFGSPLDIPEPLRGREIEFKFQNPLVQAEEEQRLKSFQQLSQMLGMAMQLDPSLAADVDIDTAFRDAVPGTGAPAKWMRDKDDADQVKQQQRQAQQADQMAARLGAAGEQVSRVATAAENVGKASTALQDAGLVGG